MAFPSPVANLCVNCRRGKAYRLPVHKHFVWGRSDHDWYLSVRAYLAFRAGTAWRPVRHHGACAAQDYRDALRVVTLAFNAQVKPVAALEPAPASARGV